jgi:hypothetical protein
MKVLFLHGLEGNPNGTKIQFLRSCGIDVVAPALSRDNFAADLQLAQRAFDEFQPDAVVGSSRGGALAANIDTREAAVVLIAPAWKNWGSTTRVGPKTVILHSEFDEVVPIAHSRELIAGSHLPIDHLIVVGDEHRMSDERALEALQVALRRAVVP